MKITDEMMAEAAAEMNEAMLRSLPDPDDCHHEFSRRFKRKMKRVIYRADHPVQFRIMQRVATIFLVISIGFATILTFSPTVRANVLGWIREQYESFVAYYFEDGTPVVNNQIDYYVSGLSADYTEAAATNAPGTKTIVYVNSSNGRILNFSYSLTPDTANYYVENIEYAVENVYVLNHPADLYLASDPSEDNCIIWCDESTNTVFYLSGFMTKDELISLAESVLPKK